MFILQPTLNPWASFYSSITVLPIIRRRFWWDMHPGATLVYTILAQSPPNTFLGGVSLGFCPSMSLPKPLCSGSGYLNWVTDQKKPGTYIFKPVSHLASPWAVLQGSADPVCLPDAVKAFVEKVENGKIIMLPKVDHGFSVSEKWMPRFREVFHDMTMVSEDKGIEKSDEKNGLSDLPIVALPVSGKGDRLAVIVTGDGGWAGIDKSMGEALNREGIPVVGLNSLKYFWHRKTPEQSAVDLGRIIRYYAGKWHRSHIILIGYSRGADVVPFMVNRQEEDARSLIKEIVLMGPQPTVDFQFHVTDWLTSGRHDTELPVMPEMRKLKNQKVMCIYGSDEKGISLCARLDNNHFRVMEIPGGHHFGGNYDKLARIIMEHVK